jgi:hypothetical protein
MSLNQSTNLDDSSEHENGAVVDVFLHHLVEGAVQR